MQFLASSPALYAATRAFGQAPADLYTPQAVASASEAINVFDMHEAAKHVLMPGHYAYMALGTDDGGTLRANREGFEQFRLRVRRLVGGSEIDTSVEIFGEPYPSPILIAPCGAQRAFHPEAEIAVARAARSRGAEQILSTVSSSTVEDVNRARGRPVWFQLYTSVVWEDTLARVKRAEDSGCPVLALTVDLPASNREAQTRFRRETNPECQACHAADTGIIPPLPMVGSTQIGSGFRRGTDIFKALAIGADAVAIGRPYLWGLSAFGQEGVETVLDILTRELEIVMRQAGTPRIDAITRDHIV